jgi:hypothetical protein
MEKTLGYWRHLSFWLREIGLSPCSSESAPLSLENSRNSFPASQKGIAREGDHSGRLFDEDTKEGRRMKLGTVEMARAEKLAKEQGRFDGEFLCPKCGMKHWTEEGAEECCIPGGLDVYEEEEKKVAVIFTPTWKWGEKGNPKSIKKSQAQTKVEILKQAKEAGYTHYERPDGRVVKL